MKSWLMKATLAVAALGLAPALSAQESCCFDTGKMVVNKIGCVPQPNKAACLALAGIQIWVPGYVCNVACDPFCTKIKAGWGAQVAAFAYPYVCPGVPCPGNNPGVWCPEGKPLQTVPTVSTIGFGVLVLLLVASGIWMVRRQTPRVASA